MVHLCTPCFLQCQVTLHLSVVLCSLVSTAHLRLSVWSSVRLSSASATKSPPKRGLPLPNCHKFTWYTLLPILPPVLVKCACKWKFGPLLLTILVGDSRCRIPVQKQGEELDSPHRLLAGSHKEDGRGGLLVKVKEY